MAPQTSEPAATSVVVDAPSTAELVESAVATWRTALVETVGGATLADVDLLGDGPLDLSAAHPSGIAQLFAGRDTRLSNLVREGAALSAAKRRARAVGSRADEYAQRYGVAPTYLSIGVATWTEHAPPEDLPDGEVPDDDPDSVADDVAALASAVRGRSVDEPFLGDDAPARVPAAPSAGGLRTVRAPVLLRPVALRARGSGESELELTLEPSLEVNPVLARALRNRGALLDPVTLARGAFTGTGFDPRAALDRLAALGAAVLDDFELRERLLVGTFVHPGRVLVEDLDQHAHALDDHEVVAALAGDASARARVRRPLREPVAGDRHPDAERGVGDLDPAQQHVLDVLATGSHLFVDAPAGCDVRGTVSAVVADAAARGLTVLYVPGHRRAATALAARLGALGVDDLLLDVAPDPGWRTAATRRLLGAMTLEPEPVDTDRVSAVRRDLVVHRDRLGGYVTALHTARAPWGASPYDALQALARLTAARPAPQTTVRLSTAAVRGLAAPARRAELAGDLVQVARLGAFTLRPSDTPWFGADLVTPEAADDTVERIERLVATGLPAVVERVREVAAATGLVPATSVADWGDQLGMLSGVRAALDVFQPMIFERTATDMVAATASRAWRAEHDMPMSWPHRRRLRKQARDMLRPGPPVADLHLALLDVQEQREVWQAHCPSGGWPRLPDGLADIEDEYAALVDDVEHVARVLATTPAGGGLLGLPFADLADRLRRLLVDRRALETLPERTAVLRALGDAGLGGLLEDLAHRRVAPGLVGAELELAWWSSVFDELLRSDPALAGYDGAALTALAAEFRALDLEHVASLSAPVRTAVVTQMRGLLTAQRTLAQELYVELAAGRLTHLREGIERFGDLVRRLRPVLAASPMLVPQLLPVGRTVDVVVLDAVQHLPLEVTLAALVRARQVVVVGDPRSASGSAVRELAEVLPRVALRAAATRRDPHLTAFLVDHGYAGVLEATPLPHATPLVRLDVVDGSGVPDPVTGAVESTRAEVDHVVEMVITHALTRPEESLAVISPSAVHAARVREAVLGEVRANPALAPFFDAGRAEPFVSTDLAGVAGLRREAVVLSMGFGRTPHGRVLHRFGPLGGPGGEALLLDALGATRHRLTVVSCFAAEDLDPERLRGPGSRLLGDLLAFAAERGRAAGPVVDGGPPVAPPGTRDRLVTDLAERLWRAGLVVEVGYGVAGSARIPLAVGHPDLPGEMLVAVLTDDELYVAEPSVRVRDRQVPQRLERLGWAVVQVWSAAAFLDPQAEADSIARAVHARLAERRAQGAGDAAASGTVMVPTTLPASGQVPVRVPVEPVVVPSVVPSDEPVVVPLDVSVGPPPGGTGVPEALPGEPAAELGSEADEEPEPARAAGAAGDAPAGPLGDGPEPAASSAIEPPDAGTGLPRGAAATEPEPEAEETAAEDGASLHVSPGTVGVPTGEVPVVQRPRTGPGAAPDGSLEAELAALAARILADGGPRDPAGLAGALRAALDVAGREAADASVARAARRALG